MKTRTFIDGPQHRYFQLYMLLNPRQSNDTVPLINGIDPHIFPLLTSFLGNRSGISPVIYLHFLRALKFLHCEKYLDLHKLCHNSLKVPKREIFDRSDSPDFYTIKSSWVGDLLVKILTYYFNF
jgi:hypothetical protein